MISQLKKLLPESLEPAVYEAWFAMRPAVRATFHGTQRYCPVCESRSRFFLAHGKGAKRRPDIFCPVCLSRRRHRLAWLFFQRKTDLLDGRRKRLLHFAPERTFIRKFQSVPGLDYLSADLVSVHAMVKQDITKMTLDGGAFDAIYCSHLLEHVPDDRAAMREMARVLRPGGWAVIQVPTIEGATDEDPSVLEPAERKRRWGDPDHVRLYGLDILDRLNDAGFDARVWHGRDIANPEEIVKMSLNAHEPLFYAVKR